MSDEIERLGDCSCGADDARDAALATPPTEGAQQIAALLAAAKAVSGPQNSARWESGPHMYVVDGAAFDALVAALKVLQ